jgi:hypothetical protein
MHGNNYCKLTLTWEVMHINLCGFYNHSKVKPILLQDPSLVLENIKPDQGL